MSNLLERSRFRTEVRKYNTRLNTLANRLGTDSPIYQAEASKIQYWFDTENIRYNKNGVIQIAKPSSLTDKMNLNQLKNINIKQWQVVKKEYEESFKQFEKETPTGQTKISLSEYINNMANLSENLGALYQTFKDNEIQRRVNNALDIMRKSKKSYSDLFKASQVINDILGAT